EEQAAVVGSEDRVGSVAGNFPVREVDVERSKGFPVALRGGLGRFSEPGQPLEQRPGGEVAGAQEAVTVAGALSPAVPLEQGHHAQALRPGDAVTFSDLLRGPTFLTDAVEEILVQH